MEVTKYLCEFFFTNFWHWFGLVLLVGGAQGIFKYVKNEVKG